jgi:hypothetical protein
MGASDVHDEEERTWDLRGMMRRRMRYAKNEEHVPWRILATTPQTPAEKMAHWHPSRSETEQDPW